MAPESVTELDVAIVGAGFCGTSVAAALQRYGVDSFAVLEQGAQAGAFWKGTYDRLALHTPWHSMPDDGGLSDAYPMYKPRDDLLQYFGQYVERHQIAERFHFGRKVGRVKHVADESSAGARWEIETDRGLYRSRFVAMCTSYQRVPHVPAFADRELFRGKVLHSHSFKNAAPFRGQRMLVVGSGNSACEIAAELAESGAESVTLLVHGPRYFVTKADMTRIACELRPIGRMGPEAVRRAHPFTAGTEAFERVMAERDRDIQKIVVDMSPHGIAQPKHGYMHEVLIHRRFAVIDVGAIDLIREGKIQVVNGVIDRFTPRGVQIVDGGELEFDAAVLGTGFRHALDEFLADHATLLAPQTPHLTPHPQTDRRCRSVVWPSIFFVGFDVTLVGGQSYGHWGWETGEKIATELGVFDPSMRPAEYGGKAPWEE